MKNTLLIASMLFALGVTSPLAKAVEYRVQATLQPNLNGGPDPRGFEGFSSVIVVTIPGTSMPVSTTATTATYSLAAGAMHVMANESTGARSYKSTGAGTVTLTVSQKNPDAISVQAPFTFQGKTFTMSFKTILANGSFSSTALKHPTKFTPSNQTISSPTSYFTYTLGGTTKLGLAGNVLVN